MRTNPIQNLVRARLAALQAKFEESATMAHMGLRGQLREGYLIDFFRDVIPQGLQVTSGMICDASDATSRQLDFIVVDPKLLPSMALSADVSIVPVEAALLTAEIKSTLHGDALKQVTAQQRGIADLRYSHRADNASMSVSPGKLIIPSVVLAYECQVAENTLRQFMLENPDMLGICSIGKHAFLRLGPEEVTIVEAAEEKGKFWETLVFVGKLYHALLEVSFMRAIRPNWDQYMQGWTGAA